MRANRKKELPHAELIRETLKSYQQIMRVFMSGVMPQWVALDLTFSQLKALHLVGHHRTLTVSQLAKLLGMGNPAASILVQQMVQQNLVGRVEDSQDRRRTFVHLTPKANELLIERQEQVEGKFRRWLEQMGDADLTNLMLGLEALVEIVRVEQEQTSLLG